MSEPLIVYHSHPDPVKPPPLPPQLVELQRACIGTLVAAYRLVGAEVRVEVLVVMPVPAQPAYKTQNEGEN